ncbi:MAG: TOBE domain-containing protein [Halanaeroarchaeum sp.]
MDAAFEAQLRAGEVTFEAADAELLEAIDEEASLNAAADSLGRSYSRAQKRLNALEDAFGPLVERHRGGRGGGGTTLTEQGHALLAAFERLATGYASVAETEETVLRGTVASRDGELAVVETDAGPLRAIAPRGASEVQVSIRSDAVTLNEPADAPPAGGTSARNRFDGTVAAVEEGEAICRVAVDVGAADPLLTLVTRESLERLDLAPGRDVVVTFKATATRCTPIS